MTSFDHLSTDLIQQIFHYLTFIDLFHAFFGLQNRLDNTIRDYPVCLYLSRVISEPYLQSFSLRSRSLILSGPDLYPFEVLYSRLRLESLRGVAFIKMNLLTLHDFIGRLPMHQVESMIVGRLTWQYYPLDLYKEVWSIIMNAVDGSRLRYLHLPYHGRYWKIETLASDFTVLRRATLEYISVSQMLMFMSHAPNLRRFKACLASPHRDLFRFTRSHSKLTHLTLILQDEWSLEQIQQLFTMFPYLSHLNVKLEVCEERKIMFQSSTWEALIEEKLPDLIFFRLHLNCIIVDAKDYNLDEEFHRAEYWLQRQPYFRVILEEIQREFL